MSSQPSDRTVLIAQVVPQSPDQAKLIEAFLEHAGEALRASGGKIVQRFTGELVATFADAREAMFGAVAVQESRTELPKEERPPAPRIGFHHGPVVMGEQGLSGASVVLAKRLAGEAGPGEIYLQSETLDWVRGAGLSIRLIGERTLRGQEQPIELHQVLWNEPDATTVRPLRATSTASPMALVLERQGVVHRLEGEATLRLGRAQDCDWVIDEEGVSRGHATLYAEDGRFYVADTSTNGTYLLREGEVRSLFVRRDELRLREEGWIGLGAEPTQGAQAPWAVHYRLEAL